MLEPTTVHKKPHLPRASQKWCPDAVDEVTRHLLHARGKIEAVELEFAQIMEELAAYGDKLPAVTPQPLPDPVDALAPNADHQASPPLEWGAAMATTEYFSMDTPCGARFSSGPT